VALVNTTKHTQKKSRLTEDSQSLV